jgi:hypothetical protein
VQIGDNRAAEWVRRSNPVALGLLFSGLAGQLKENKRKHTDLLFIHDPTPPVFISFIIQN